MKKIEKRNKLINKKKSINKALELKGSALLLTVFILAGMMLVAISSSYVVTLGIKAAGIQSQSTKAYFVAESGIEQLLWQVRKGEYSFWEDETPLNEAVFSFSFSSDSRYDVYYQGENTLTWRSVGEFGNTKRSVEVQM